MEQMKNSNEYRDDGKLYIKKIKRCQCTRTDDEDYTLICWVIQRGENIYTYRKGGDRICRAYSDKALWLSQEAKEMVEDKIEEFDTYIAALENGEFKEVVCEDAQLSIFYRDLHGKYDFVMRHRNAKTDKLTTELFRAIDIDDFLHKLRFFPDIRESESRRLFKEPTRENIAMHPMISAARENGDKKLEIEIKLYYHLETSQECVTLAEMTGLRILPPLPEAYNKSYVIEAASIRKDSYELLARSGYQFFHTPNFGMMGKTRNNHTFNPHTKNGVDAARADREAISFGEFLKLYEEADLF